MSRDYTYYEEWIEMCRDGDDVAAIELAERCEFMEAKITKLRDELKGALLDILYESGAVNDAGIFDSMARRSLADAIYRLVEMGELEIIGEPVGRRVMARRKE